jgi:7-cyano-7-deazaguanine synthase
VRELLLFSGGIDSSALASLGVASAALFIDYGQRSAAGELTASTGISSALGIELHTLRIDCGSIGSGILAGSRPSHYARSPEWWPFRNQLLVTLAASWGLPRGVKRIVVGSVRTDRERHADGAPQFYEALASLLRIQEGQTTVVAPALNLTSVELVERSRLTDQLLVLTHSCDASSIACGFCPSCDKRRLVLEELGRLQ